MIYCVKEYFLSDTEKGLLLRSKIFNKLDWILELDQILFMQLFITVYFIISLGI